MTNENNLLPHDTERELSALVKSGWKVDRTTSGYIIYSPNGDAFNSVHLPVMMEGPSLSPYECDHFDDPKLLEFQDQALEIYRLVLNLSVHNRRAYRELVRGV